MTESEAEAQTKNAPFVRPAQILICGEHRMIQEFPQGSTWAEVERVIEQHKQDVHGPASRKS